MVSQADLAAIETFKVSEQTTIHEKTRTENRNYTKQAFVLFV
jgi:hypothetical protein